ncbi:MAG: hypothetical protein U1E76_05855 [Planctomycetota bacterium]
MQGSALGEAERHGIAQRLARYTGLSPEFIDRANLRVSMERFTKELLRAERRTLGRLDSRYLGIDSDAAGETFQFDASYAAIQGPFTAALNDYVRRELHFESDLPYEILTGRVHPWSFGSSNRYLDVADTLRSAMTQNQALHVFVAGGYYDFATPYFAAQYTIDHMGIDPSLRGHLTSRALRGGPHDVHPRAILAEAEAGSGTVHAQSAREPVGYQPDHSPTGGSMQITYLSGTTSSRSTCRWRAWWRWSSMRSRRRHAATCSCRPRPTCTRARTSFLHAMPAHLPGKSATGIKWVSGYPRNPLRGLPYISGLMVMNDSDTGIPVGVLDASWITAVRTGACTAATARSLARPGAQVLAILGCGVQGRTNAEALRVVLPGLAQPRSASTSCVPTPTPMHARCASACSSR